jgi:PEP-CTERM motif
MIATEQNVTANRRRGPTSVIFGVAVATLAFFAPVGTRPARAGLIVQALNSTAEPGGTGAFDVVVSDTAGTFVVAGFSIELSVPGASGVSFSDVTTGTLAASYLFGTLQLPPITFDTFPTQDFSAGDLDLTPPGFVMLNPGDTFGLAHVTYSVNSGAHPGPIAVSLVTAGTSLSDNDGGPVSITTSNGTITVSAQSVPEPSSLVLAGLAAALLTATHHGLRSARVKSLPLRAHASPCP